MTMDRMAYLIDINVEDPVYVAGKMYGTKASQALEGMAGRYLNRGPYSNVGYEEAMAEELHLLVPEEYQEHVDVWSAGVRSALQQRVYDRNERDRKAAEAALASRKKRDNATADQRRRNRRRQLLEKAERIHQERLNSPSGKLAAWRDLYEKKVSLVSKELGIVDLYDEDSDTRDTVHEMAKELMPTKP